MIAPTIPDWFIQQKEGRKFLTWPNWKDKLRAEKPLLKQESNNISKTRCHQIRWMNSGGSTGAAAVQCTPEGRHWLLLGQCILFLILEQQFDVFFLQQVNLDMFSSYNRMKCLKKIPKCSNHLAAINKVVQSELEQKSLTSEWQTACEGKFNVFKATYNARPELLCNNSVLFGDKGCITIWQQLSFAFSLPLSVSDQASRHQHTHSFDIWSSYSFWIYRKCSCCL